MTFDGGDCFVACALGLCDESTTVPELATALAKHEPMLSRLNLECVARQAIAAFAAQRVADATTTKEATR